MNLKIHTYRISEDSKVVEIAKRMITNIGLKPNIRISCSGTDAANYNVRGFETIVVGKGGKDSHTKKEA